MPFRPERVHGPQFARTPLLRKVFFFPSCQREFCSVLDSGSLPVPNLSSFCRLPCHVPPLARALEAFSAGHVQEGCSSPSSRGPPAYSNQDKLLSSLLPRPSASLTKHNKWY